MRIVMTSLAMLALVACGRPAETANDANAMDANLANTTDLNAAEATDLTTNDADTNVANGM